MTNTIQKRMRLVESALDHQKRLKVILKAIQKEKSLNLNYLRLAELEVDRIKNQIAELKNEAL